MCMCVWSTLCNCMDCSLTGSSVHEVFQAGILEWVDNSFSRGSSKPGIEHASLASPALQVDSIPHATRKTLYVYMYMYMYRYIFAQSCLTVCNSMDCSLPSSSVHRILQARILEWVTIPFSRGSSQPRDRTWVSCIAGGSFRSEALRKPSMYICVCMYLSSETWINYCAEVAREILC